MAHPHPRQRGGHVNRQFPPAFYLYSTSLGGRKYALGEHKNQPLYAVTTHAGWSGKADTVLHSGPSPDAPPLATAEGGNTVVGSVDVDLSGAVQGSSSSSRERMKPTGFGCTHRNVQFEMDMGAGRREAFEWRTAADPRWARWAGRTRIGSWCGWAATGLRRSSRFGPASG
ncbi:hypothetical protein DL769_011333 [Monosporascus sp. CRB-8-3]|nr:hypothetical protein DL769_011333 [Monosporascus sp. CRB-8-3]